MRRLALLPLVALSLLAHADDKKVRQLTSDDLKALAWRSVGPANMGGRVADIALAPGNGKSFFVALGCGGVWKTTNRGTTLAPVFEHESTSSIGSVKIADAPENWKGWDDEKDVPKADRAKKGLGKIVWVGTGEGNGRNSSSWGDGMYRSTDGGASWKHLGLEDSRDIPRIALDPRDPDVCYAAAMGHLWGPNKTRGVYKTTDGGKNWQPSLQVDENTGAIDVVVDAKNPDTVYAAMYGRRRTAYSFESGSTTGGIFRSKDAGKHWEKLTKGLPSQNGRIGLDVSQSNPKVVMACIESDLGGAHNMDDNRSKFGGVFRSEDGGDSWTRVNAQIPRAFYFSKVRIDPQEDKRVYLLGWDVWRSEDGGKTFATGLTEKLHVDWHAMAIDPTDSDHLLVGSDGGLYQSFDRGATWDFLNSMAIGQFYNVAVDNQDPYRIMGGLQDNGSWLGTSSSLYEAGANAIVNGDWRAVGGGDGFHVAFDPTDSNFIYLESQGGYMGRMNIPSGEGLGLRPDPKEGQAGFRFNWNTPFIVSPHDSNTLYMGGNRVFKLTQRGEQWQAVSPDLTTKDPDKMITTGSNAETYCTVVALAESSVVKGMLWAGTDDGRIQVTANDGGKWDDVTPKDVNGGYVATVEPSHFNRDVAYAAIDRHRSDDYDPLLLATSDGGKNWRRITGDLPKSASVRVLREDAKNAGVLYCGTETAAYVSIDGGSHWVKLAQGMPTVGVHDLVQQTQTGDLVAATHGRSIYVLDDASSLSQLTPDRIQQELFVFEPVPARPRLKNYLDGLWGDKFFAAANPAPGAKITYWVRDKQDGSASVKIEDAKGATVVTLTGPAKEGLNRVIWDMLPDEKHRLQNQGESAGMVYVPAGTYTVTVTLGKSKQTTKLVVSPYLFGSPLPINPVSRQVRNGIDD